MNLSLEADDPLEQRLARQCYALTEDGKVGRSVYVSPEYATGHIAARNNHYRVVKRSVQGRDVLLRLECSDSQRPVEEDEAKRVVVDFLDGCLKGVRLDTRSASPEEALLARSYYAATNRGRATTPVHAFSAAQGARPDRCRLSRDRCQDATCQYLIVKRTENLGTVVLRLASEGGEYEDER